MKDVFISSNDFQILKKILEPFSEVYFFGSRVTGNYKPFSDLDVCICEPNPVSNLLLGDLKEKFQNSSLPFTVDLSDFSQLPEFLQKKFETEKVSVNEARPAL